MMEKWMVSYVVYVVEIKPEMEKYTSRSVQ